MPSLLELQERFGAALESGGAAFSPALDVYRHAIRANYRRALASTYPVARELLGVAAFDDAVDAFVAARPPISGDLNIYGDRFPAFLERYLPPRADARDMACLEWAIDESARAADVDSTPTAVIAALTTLEEDAIAHAVLTMHPSCRFLSASTPTYETWFARQRGAIERGAGLRRIDREFLLVRRSDGRVVVESIQAGEFTWLRALQAGETFGDALGQALERDAGFDLERALAERVHDGTICGIEPGRYNPRHG